MNGYRLEVYRARVGCVPVGWWWRPVILVDDRPVTRSEWWRWSATHRTATRECAQVGRVLVAIADRCSRSSR